MPESPESLLVPEALQRRLDAQSYPAAALYVVATPIGNLGDITVRALAVLKRMDFIAAEDTRHTGVLLAAWGVDCPLVALHRHNEASAAAAIVERLRQGERCALVSDAGTPCVSDPGSRLVRAAHAAGLRVVPVPGASSVMAALMASGVTDDVQPAYAFAGFIPVKAGARLRWLSTWMMMSCPVVMFETAPRLDATLAALQSLVAPQRQLTFARELTKQFEEVATVPLEQARAWLDATPKRRQGEFVLILAPEGAALQGDHDTVTLELPALLTTLLRHLPLKTAVAEAQALTGLPRSGIYTLALSLRDSVAESGDDDQGN